MRHIRTVLWIINAVILLLSSEARPLLIEFNYALYYYVYLNIILYIGTYFGVICAKCKLYSLKLIIIVV